MITLKTCISHLAIIGLLTPTLCAKEVKVNTIDDAIAAYFHAIPLKKDTGSWLRYVPAKVNNSDIWMLVDSGAHRTFLDVSVAKENKIKLKRNRAGIRGVGGRKSKSYTGKVKSASFGGKLKMSEGKYQFIDLGTGKNLAFENGAATCGGLLGADVLTQVNLNIDYQKNRMLLPIKAIEDGLWGLLKQMDYTKVDLVATKSATYIPVKLGNKEGYFQIDTGSSQTVIFETFTKGKKYEPLNRGGVVEGVGKKKMKASFVTVNDFSIPGRKIASPMLVVPNGSITRIEGKPVMGILGISVIQHMKMIFNFKKQSLYLPKRGK